jgi:hypothetical protein
MTHDALGCRQSFTVRATDESDLLDGGAIQMVAGPIRVRRERRSRS